MGRRACSAGWKVGSTPAVFPSLDHRVRDDPLHESLATCRVDRFAELDASPRGSARDVEAEPLAGLEQRGGGVVGDAGQEGDLGAVGGRLVPRTLLEQRIDEEAVQPAALVLVEVTFDEVEIGDLHVLGSLEIGAELFGCRRDGCRPRVGFDGADRQTVPWGHWREPRRSRPVRMVFERNIFARSCELRTSRDGRCRAATVLVVAKWLLKSEPDVFGYDDLVRNKREGWDGVRNYQARNFMRRDATW